MKKYILVIALFLVLLPTVTFGHDFYSDWMRPDVPETAEKWVRSCCNKQDCRPVPAKFLEGVWQYLHEGMWHKVPDSKILLDQKSPDSQAHACISNTTKELLCFVKPDFGT